MCIVFLRVSDGQHCDLKIKNERDQIYFNGITIRGSIVKIVNSVLMRNEYKKSIAGRIFTARLIDRIYRKCCFTHLIEHLMHLVAKMVS